MDVREQAVKVVNKFGLHARPAMQFVDVANRFASRIIVSNGSTEMDAKSIMSVLQLAATRGTTLYLRADGEDAEKAVAALTELVSSGFGED